MKKRIPIVLVATAVYLQLTAQPAAMVVNVNEVKASVQPTMWGVFFEDINFGADGGLYAELVKNRSFEFFKPTMGWTITRQAEGDVLVLNRKEVNSTNPRFLRVAARHPQKGDVSLLNEGFRGMGFKKDLRYDFSVLYRQQKPGLKLHIELLDAAGGVIGETVLTPEKSDTNWNRQAVSLQATATEPKGRLNLWFEGEGIIDLDMISLFPSDTWKGRPGGLRADMVQMLADMKPGFVRFPGGCIVEGYDLSQRYEWKKTIGPVENRQMKINRWNFEFAHRPAPDYFQSFGLGFLEYFQLCEDIGAEPLPILNCGMACQFNSAEVVPLDELGPYVQDALDLVEFANGDATTKWGKVRADLGHPAPFHLKMMGIGNENWGPQYLERLAIFTKALKAKYPGIQLVNSSGTDPNGERFDQLNTALRSNNADIIDEHYYRRPEWFLQNAGRYDNYPRNGSKVFAGEYAAQSDRTVSVSNRNNLTTALSEAAFMTGLERNADVVTMASYAPLFAHADGWQWTPDLIWVDNLHIIGTPDYYVQKLFSLNKGTKVVSLTANGKTIAGQDSLYASAVVDEKSNDLIIKLVNVSGKRKSSNLSLEGVQSLRGEGTLTVLQGNEPDAVNTFGQPAQVAPKESTVSIKSNKLALSAPAYSLSVVRIRMAGGKPSLKKNSTKQ
ncbi:alpha-L-arabinofuranosidase C-terminal domain-containing protein [Flavisolibacter nicotianae]|uniref:alpha-L-arabinofuranosidase C-terminal domain-containing protein n=1 Tax=Flavisolibacter nicotianae TaxID=2364882 RepID=UPI000EAC2E90|nr:alpha-L-arabinofuranosidase C-terminal domain-containing protein [Flavisolibacter nicotianae]